MPVSCRIFAFVILLKVFRCANKVLKASTAFTETEYNFIKRLVELVIESDSGSVAAIDILNDSGAPLKMDAKETLLERLKQEKWINIVSDFYKVARGIFVFYFLQNDGKVVLGTRLITELEPYIKEVYRGYALECAFCRHICLRGQKCDECELRIHTHCAIKTFADVTRPKCPGKDCEADWPLNDTRTTKTAGANCTTVAW